MAKPTITAEGLWSIKVADHAPERMIGRTEDGGYVLLQRRRQTGPQEAEWVAVSDVVQWGTAVAYAHQVLAGSARAISHPQGILDLALAVAATGEVLSEASKRMPDGEGEPL